MAIVSGCATFLLLTVLVVEIAVIAADVSAIRTRGQGQTPNEKRRQQVSCCRMFSMTLLWLNLFSDSYDTDLAIPVYKVARGPYQTLKSMS
jgi:hypothetical protein